MKKILSSIFLLFIIISTNAQNTSLTKKEMKVKLDSILNEANTIYKYDRTAWLATDLARENKSLKKFSGQMVIYQKANRMIAIILDKDQKSIAEYSFDAKFSQPEAIVKTRKLNDEEQKLIKIKKDIAEQLADEKYQVGVKKGFSLNLVLIPKEVGYKLYIIPGTSQSKVIPFGNDYLFETDAEGKILKWKRFHSSLIAAQTEGPNGEMVVRLMHSHLQTTPLISATDICTFKLYAPMYNIDEFSVYASEKVFLYNLKKDTITVENLK